MLFARGPVVWRTHDLDVIDRTGGHADRGVVATLERNGYIWDDTEASIFRLTSKGAAELRRWRRSL